MSILFKFLPDPSPFSLILSTCSYYCGMDRGRGLLGADYQVGSDRQCQGVSCFHEGSLRTVSHNRAAHIEDQPPPHTPGLPRLNSDPKVKRWRKSFFYMNLGVRVVSQTSSSGVEMCLHLSCPSPHPSVTREASSSHTLPVFLFHWDPSPWALCRTLLTAPRARTQQSLRNQPSFPTHFRVETGKQTVRTHIY